jgi:hypothetical protein
MTQFIVLNPVIVAPGSPRIAPGESGPRNYSGHPTTEPETGSRRARALAGAEHNMVALERTRWG